MKSLSFCLTPLLSGDFDRWMQAAARRRSPELDFGCAWVIRDELAWLDAPHWRLSWVADTGELYAAPLANDVDWDERFAPRDRTCRVNKALTPRRAGLVCAQQRFNREEVGECLAGWDRQAMQVGPLVNPEAARLLRMAGLEGGKSLYRAAPPLVHLSTNNIR